MLMIFMVNNGFKMGMLYILIMVALLMAMLVRVRLGAVNCLVDGVLMEVDWLNVVLVVVGMV